MSASLIIKAGLSVLAAIFTGVLPPPAHHYLTNQVLRVDYGHVWYTEGVSPITPDTPGLTTFQRTAVRAVEDGKAFTVTLNARSSYQADQVDVIQWRVERA
jgi:hypothetical protein